MGLLREPRTGQLESPPLGPVTVRGQGLCFSAHCMAKMASTVKSAWEGQQRFSLWGQDLKPTGWRPSATWPLQPGLLPLASSPGGLRCLPASVHFLILCPLWDIYLCLHRTLSSLFDLCPGRSQSRNWVTVSCQGAHHGRDAEWADSVSAGPSLGLRWVSLQVPRWPV